ncbi:MAG: UDP-N-acetylglucosamine 1-carboxyvinyltransferase [Candidatus Tectimicrobiota bacterium]|nr:MAG: UDP-N-acetylglucosamine 1-carboxyvinyltransferase [Candidatus Tectomicrobia bacterium]
MQRMVIEGGYPLRGQVAVSGAKNAALPLMVAALLTDGPCELANVPALGDIRTIGGLLQQLGVRVEDLGGGKVRVNAARLSGYEAPYELVKTMRASVLVLGPLVARCGQARVSLPGGCAIGARPIDQHLAGLQALGAEIKLEHGYIHAWARRLRGADIRLRLPTVTGTENLMMAAALAAGRTRITPAAREPEVVCLAEVLNRMGARIRGAGSETIEIEGVAHLSPFQHTVIPDRIEAGTFAVAAAITAGEVTITHCRPDHLGAVIRKLRQAGVEVEAGPTTLAVRCKGPLRPVRVTTAPYPGFPTDMQAQLTVLMTQAEGISVIRETIFENRLMHVAELRRMGAHIAVRGQVATVYGGTPLSGAEVMATDLRASACLILAGLAAQGRTVVSRVYHLDRGYEAIEEKLALLGARIWRERA